MELLEEKIINSFEERLNELREDAKLQISKVQEENRATFSRGWKKALKYEVGDLVAIKQTRTEPKLKLKSKNLAPSRVTKVKSNDTYDECQEGNNHDDSRTTTTTICAEFMQTGTSDYSSSESDDCQDG